MLASVGTPGQPRAQLNESVERSQVLEESGPGNVVVPRNDRSLSEIDGEDDYGVKGRADSIM